MIENLVMPEYFKAVLVVIVDSGSTVTATLGSTVLTQTSDGTAVFDIPSVGTWKIKATKGDQTAEGTVEVTKKGRYNLSLGYYKIYGAQWAGTDSPKWTRTDSAVGFPDPVPALNNGTGTSPFDDIMPWKGMVRVEDPEAGSLVAIPKFWYKWTAVGNGLKLQIANGKPDEPGFFVSPAHMDRGDGKGERDVVYVGRYHCGDDWKSKTGTLPKVQITRATARTSIHALGSDIWQSDWHMHMTILMLYLVEFADWDSQTAIGYGCGNAYSAEIIGKSDAMLYYTGTPYSSRQTYGVGIQYRNIEGLWDNVFDWTDGCYNNADGFHIINNPSYFSDKENGSLLSARISGYPSKFEVKELYGFQTIYPIEINGSDTTYTYDVWHTSNANNINMTIISIGGQATNKTLSIGINSINSEQFSRVSGIHGSRLQKLPDPTPTT